MILLPASTGSSLKKDEIDYLRFVLKSHTCTTSTSVVALICSKTIVLCLVFVFCWANT